MKRPEELRDYASSQTLVEAIERIPDARESGMRFLGFGPEERYITYREIYGEARRRAAHLTRLGLRKGDRVAVMINEAHEFIMTFLGCVIAGVLPASLSPPMAPKAGENFLATAARIIDDAEASLFVTTESNRAFADQLLPRISREIRLLTIAEAFADDPPPFEAPEINPQDTCFLQYTSGSTGSPRGVVVTHANLMSNISIFLGPHGLNCDDSDLAVSWLPLYHDMGLIGLVLGSLTYIGPIVIISTTSFARDPRVWLRAIDKYRATITFAPNFAYSQVVKRLTMSGGEGAEKIGLGDVTVTPDSSRAYVNITTAQLAQARREHGQHFIAEIDLKTLAVTKRFPTVEMSDSIAWVPASR